ncbi:Clavaminate synthase-like protein [Wolfiporia cocos MD-104 SS10]|uniref:Clavaminate synthase-like protein n=1 Tax=Wolfiporia cocos (strain MD-104) TaxID=742152 RepID=A0A2H3J3V5_WOLCO|nr:Clavaminate synthase-like protein [Wolfiporia cocos MD-104 SS10]
MPSLTVPAVPKFIPAPPSQEPLDYADLAIVDLSNANTPGGLAELALQVRNAVSEIGFFYAVNHGLTQAENERILDIADVPFNSVKDEEKQTYLANIKDQGSYQGYKLRSLWTIDADVRDQVEHYNINKDVTRKEHPKAIRPLLPEIDAFIRFNHFNVMHPILRLLALGMELPEDTFVANHQFSVKGETYIRFMKYYPRSEDDEAKTKNVWMKGHTDIGSVTALWSQPVLGLQILSPDGKWRWVKHIENAIIVNAGDAMEFFSGGLYKATIHRVVQPPKDQHGYPRLGVFYFCHPDDNTKLVPYAESPVIQRMGVRRRFEDDNAPTMEMWRKGRTSAYGLKELHKTGERVEEHDIVNGIAAKYYI